MEKKKNNKKNTLQTNSTYYNGISKPISSIKEESLMKEIDGILKSLSDGLKAVAKSVEAAAKQVETLSKSRTKKVKAPAQKKTTVRKPARKAPPKRKVVKEAPKSAAKKPVAKQAAKRVTAVDTVYNMISRSRKGVAVSDLKSKTGFNDKKVANIVYKLKQQGKIKSSAKGIYSKA